VINEDDRILDMQSGPHLFPSKPGRCVIQAPESVPGRTATGFSLLPTEAGSYAEAL